MYAIYERMDADTVVFKCLFNECNAQLPSLRRLLFHMRLVHGFVKNASLCCAIGKCEKTYSTSDSYRKHVEREHRCELDVDNASTSAPSFPLVTVSDANITDDEIIVTDSNDEQNSGHILQLLTQHVTMLALQIRELYVLPKSTCSSIMRDMSSLFKTFFQHFSLYVCSRLEHNGFDIGVDPGLRNLLVDSSLMESAWVNIESDSRLRSYCKQNLGLIEPQTVVLGTDTVTGKLQSYQYIPVTKTLKFYVQHVDVWENMKRTRIRQPDVWYDYSDGSAFKHHPFFRQHPHAIRLHFYTDELELCNPLGGAKKKHCITTVYFQIGNVTQKHLSSLKSIHVACIVKSVLVKKYGLPKVLERLIEDLITLECDGFEVVIDGKSCRLFASLATVSADNLASHDIGGFRMCFSSGRICRFCMACYEKMNEYCSETDANYPRLRTISCHKNHVDAVCADNSLASVYGVYKLAAFHSFNSFDATTSLPPDCMHDILEGVIPIDLKVCLRGLIADKIITIPVFNDRLQRFKFGHADSKNVPNMLSLSFPKTSISGSASQKWCLFRNLSFIIGDLVPVDNKYWELYILCRKLTEIIFAPAISSSQIAYLDILIRDHHTVLLQLAPESFTPKCHFLTHYPRLISVYGPLRHMWCMRFESYHQYLKTVIEHTGNFKNVCRTLADRNQMRKCLEQSGNNCLSHDFVTVPQNKISLLSLPKCLHRPLTRYFGCTTASQVIAVSSVVVDGVNYSLNDCFVLDVMDDVPVFFVILHILAYDTIWALAGHLAFCSEFLSHYHAYAISFDPEWLVLRPGVEKSYHSLDIYKIDFEDCEKQVVALRHAIVH